VTIAEQQFFVWYQPSFARTFYQFCSSLSPKRTFHCCLCLFRRSHDSLLPNDSLLVIFRPLLAIDLLIDLLMLLDDFLVELRPLSKDMPVLVARLPLPARLEEFSEFEFRKGMGLGIEDDVCQGQDVRGAEEEVEVFQCFGLAHYSVSKWEHEEHM